MLLVLKTHTVAVEEVDAGQDIERMTTTKHNLSPLLRSIIATPTPAASIRYDKIK
ncbi:hypothetical protein PPACK8108_LOCUS12361 [Phakopsora pachyrhizi]|uniref:Uncharacterized protein n=1 Tax=Phakopsora pachyrhizi TaxID=170000 RepID=A0AAV0B3Q6_PHAPC|nr:hypothetical protein PPACK8108_LOCUS12361 [Phakopsora pachyrhizi]